MTLSTEQSTGLHESEFTLVNEVERMLEAPEHEAVEQVEKFILDIYDEVKSDSLLQPVVTGTPTNYRKGELWHGFILPGLVNKGNGNHAVLFDGTGLHYRRLVFDGSLAYAQIPYQYEGYGDDSHIVPTPAEAAPPTKYGRLVAQVLQKELRHQQWKETHTFASEGAELAHHIMEQSAMEQMGNSRLRGVDLVADRMKHRGYGAAAARLALVELAGGEDMSALQTQIQRNADEVTMYIPPGTTARY